MLDFSYLLNEAHSNISLLTIDGELGLNIKNNLKESLKNYFIELNRRVPIVSIINQYTIMLSSKIIINEAISNIIIADSFFSILDNWVGDNSFILNSQLSSHMPQIVEQGYNIQMVEFADKIGMENNLGNLNTNIYVVREQVAKQVEQSINIITSQINNTSRRAVQSIIAQALIDKQSPANLVNSINTLLKDNFIGNRADLIAITNANDMLSMGAFMSASDVGSKRKSWVTVGDERVDPIVCASNESQGSIPISHPHQSGHMHPTGHIRCRCVEVYSRPTKIGLAPFLGF